MADSQILIWLQRYEKKMTHASICVNFYTFMCIFLSYAEMFANDDGKEPREKDRRGRNPEREVIGKR